MYYNSRRKLIKEVKKCFKAVIYLGHFHLLVPDLAMQRLD